MNATGYPDPDLPNLAYPYALDALTPAERAALHHRRARAARADAAAFDATVRIVLDTLADLGAVHVAVPPAGLEDRIQRAVDRIVRASCDGGGGAVSAKTAVRQQISRALGDRSMPSATRRRRRCPAIRRRRR